MKRVTILISILLSIATLASNTLAQSQSTTIDGLVASAKTAAGLDWAGTFVTLCVPTAPAPASPARGATPRTPPGPPARETWFGEPAKVADNLYFIGTRIHNSWAIVGSGGIIVLEALFDYAAQEEI